MQWKLGALNVRLNSVMDLLDMEEGEYYFTRLMWHRYCILHSPNEQGETTLDAMIMDG